MALAQDDTMIRIPKTMRATLRTMRITRREAYYEIIDRLIKAQAKAD